MVSIVIPCFNAERTISATIDSALGQTYNRCEVIVVDDGSTDDSVNIAQSYGECTHLESGPNRGASSARNRGTILAKGEYIQYLDADDLLTADTLERRVDAIRGAGSDVAYTDWQRFTQLENGDCCYLETVEQDMVDVDCDPEVACATQFWAPPAAILYHRGVVDEIGGWKEDLPIIQDARFLFDAAHVGAVFIRVPGIGAYYRTSNAESLSSKDSYGFILDVMNNADQVQDIWASENSMTRKRQEALAGIYDYAARSMLEYDEDQFRKALQRVHSLGAGRKSIYVTLAGTIYRLFGFQRTRSIMKLAAKARRALSAGAGYVPGR